MPTRVHERLDDQEGPDAHKGHPYMMGKPPFLSLPLGKGRGYGKCSDAPCGRQGRGADVM